MKKAISLVLAVLLATALPGSVLAVGAGESSSQDVTGQYVSGGESLAVYSVDIAWGNLAFTYTDAFEGTWNPETHAYEGATPASWTPNNAEITVTNHSNTEITVTPSYRAEAEYESAQLNFDNQSVTVESADNGEDGNPGTPEKKIITATVSGTLPEGTNNKIGTITIQID